MIPKVIHYCWFGRNKLPKLAIECIESWKKNLPDYKIIEWNEDNFDINSNQYVKEAYESKKWAFVTDYVRLYVLKEYGGIYMDTDVEVTQNLDEFLNCGAFSGFESNNYIPTGIIGAEKDNKWIERMLQEYDNKKFIKEDGSYDMTTNVVLITDITKKEFNIKLNNTYQELKHRVIMYPSDYFCPKSYETGKIRKTKNTYAIHHFSGSWHSDEEKKIRKRKMMLTKVFSEKTALRILGYSEYISKNGIYESFKKLISKV